MTDGPLPYEKARAKILAGTLPARRPDRTLGGPGQREAGSVCGDPIPRDHMELELEFNRPGGEPASERYHCHPRCVAAWELELHNLGPVQGDSDTSSAVAPQYESIDPEEPQRFTSVPGSSGMDLFFL